ncbi:MBOAT family protein [Paenibacillus alba]|uniref:MBOAT family protein n=1 Tax=Paenibacillus alba TaxID=1197127 RepID=UPI001566DCB7|nr:MBOAT family protein [Paenibacillus alba]
MVFSSLIFLFLFLPLTLLVYYVSPNVLRNFILLVVSLVFYAWGEPLYILIMIFSTGFDFMNGLLIEKYRSHMRIAQAILINSLVVSIGILCFFKYYGFVVDNINQLFHLNIHVTALPLPIGISFYTFQTMSYIVDVYRDKIPAQKNMISFGSYVTMFPQLVAGPIVKYGDISKQLNERKVTLNQFGEGAELFIRGLAKKVLLANNIGLLWTSVKATPMDDLTVLSAWLGILAFTFQIYFDFSGYSDMARGLGKMFGFTFMENFNYPYISKSVTEFWRRWHISLGTWFREYVYIPLGGNRAGKRQHFRNLFVVWLLTGLWHGASWNFVLWGLYFGLFVKIEKLFLLKWLTHRPNFVGHLYTMTIVIVGWVLFEFEQLSVAMEFIGTMFGFGAHEFVNRQALYYLSTNIVLLMVLAICATPLPIRAFHYLKGKLNMSGVIVAQAVYFSLLILSTAYLVNETYNPFLYFRF